MRWGWVFVFVTGCIAIGYIFGVLARAAGGGWWNIVSAISMFVTAIWFSRQVPIFKDKDNS